MSASDGVAALAQARRRFSSRLTPPPTPVLSLAIHFAVLAVWVALFLLVFSRGGILAWSVGLAYLAYDAALLFFTGWHIRRFTTEPANERPDRTPQEKLDRPADTRCPADSSRKKSTPRRLSGVDPRIEAKRPTKPPMALRPIRLDGRAPAT